MNATLLRNTILGSGLFAAVVMLGSFYSVVQDSVDRSGSFRSQASVSAAAQR